MKKLILDIKYYWITIKIFIIKKLIKLERWWITPANEK